MEGATGFFEERPGVKSITRLMVFMLILYGIVASGAILIAGLWRYITCGDGENLMNVVGSSTVFLSGVTTFAAGWKLIQKPMEKEKKQANGG